MQHYEQLNVTNTFLYVTLATGLVYLITAKTNLKIQLHSRKGLCKNCYGVSSFNYLPFTSDQVSPEIWQPCKFSYESESQDVFFLVCTPPKIKTLQVEPG